MSSGPDVQTIFTDNPGALPSSFIAGSDFTLKSAFARVDGTGAAGSFIPTLILTAQDGHVIAQVSSDTTWAAGDTGVVTFAPFLARRVSAAPPPPSGAVVQFFQIKVVGFAVGPGLTAVVFSSVVDHSDGLTFALSGGGNLQILVPGFYMFHLMQTGTVNAAGTDTEWDYQFDVIAGTQGFWTTKRNLIANEGFASTITRVNLPAGAEALGDPSVAFNGCASWVTGNTFPVEIQVSSEKFENGVDVADNSTFFLTAMQIGQPFS